MFSRKINGGGRGGFSLVEVALALTVAAGGMVAIFGLFPAGLRQGANSNRDLVGSSFAGAALSAIAGNVAAIDDVQVWNDPKEWWKRAVENTNLPGWSSGKEPKNFRGDTSVFLPNRSKVHSKARDNASGESGVWFFSDDDGQRDVKTEGVALPPHYIVRLVRVRRTPRRVSYESLRGYVNVLENYGKKMYGSSSATDSSIQSMLDGKGQKHVVEPDRYIVSLVSSDQKGYSIFVNEPVYSQEFHFLHRP